MLPTVPTFVCKNSQLVAPSCQYPFWQNSPLCIEPSPIDNNTDLALINTANILQSDMLFQNVPHHSRYSIPQGAAMNLHYMEPLTGPTVQNQKDVSSYQTFYHSQTIDSISHPNIDDEMKSAESNVMNSPTISNRHQVMAGGEVFPRRVVTTPVTQRSIRPAYGRTNSAPILLRTTKGALESQLIRSHHYAHKSYSESQMGASNEKSLYKSVGCDESPNHNYRQKHWWCNSFTEDIQEPVFLSKVMEAEDVLNGYNCDENISRPDEPERREVCFLIPSIRRSAQGLESIHTRSTLNSDPMADRAHMRLTASASFPGFHPIDSSQHEMKYLSSNERQNAKDEEVCVFHETSLAASDMCQPNTVIDLFQQNRLDDMIHQCLEPKTYHLDNSRRDSFFEEAVCALNGGIDPFAVDDTECHTQRSGSAEYYCSKAITRGVAFEATGKNCVANSFNALLVTSAQQNDAEDFDNSQTNDRLFHNGIHVRNVQQQRQIETPEINTEEVQDGDSLASSFTPLGEDLDLRSLASIGSEENVSGDDFIDFIEKTIAYD